MKISAIKLNPLWEERPLTKEDKVNYNKMTGLNAEKLYVIKDEAWAKIMNLQFSPTKNVKN